MKVAANIFWIIGLFFIAAATLYGFWVEWTEWAGIPAIYAVGGMSWMIAWYLNVTERKYGVGPADDADGQIADYAGTYGTFAPWSWWPIGLGASAAFLFFGLAIDWWVFLLGLIPGLFFVTGWVMEFNRKRYAH